MRYQTRLGRLGAFFALLTACGSPVAPTDAGFSDAGLADTGPTRQDAGPGLDASPPEQDAGATSCAQPPSCAAPLPDLGETTDWRHTSSRITAGIGSPRHRGRDLWLTESDPQWALGKFAYGGNDDDIKDEDVDIYVLRGCEGDWERLGTATTTEDDEHATVEGVEDTGGASTTSSPGPNV